jgi:catalase
MAMKNPAGRANYEPNSWGPKDGGPREDPKRGFMSHPEPLSGEKERVRPESFADHYSQARQFYVSQTSTEQRHMADALVFELSKVDTMAIRERMVGHLRNIDKDLAKAVADGLGIGLPKKPKPAKKPITDLPASDALSILKNAPETFEGRKLGILATDGGDAALLKALNKAVEAAGGTVEVITSQVGGVALSDGKTVEGDEKVDGGPSVLYDAVALLVSEDGADALTGKPPARDFVADAFAPCKFIGYTEAALPLMEKAGIAESLDDGCIALDGPKTVKAFAGALPRLRYWDREA